MIIKTMRDGGLELSLNPEELRFFKIDTAKKLKDFMCIVKDEKQISLQPQEVSNVD